MSNMCNTIGDGNRSERSATIECCGFNVRYTVWDEYRCKINTKSKSKTNIKNNKISNSNANESFFK